MNLTDEHNTMHDPWSAWYAEPGIPWFSPCSPIVYQVYATANPNPYPSPVPFHIEQPLWLLSAIIALPMGIAALTLFACMSRLRRTLAAIVRVALVCLIAAILAGLATVRETNRLAVIAVIDVSGSVQRITADGVGTIPGANPATSTLEAVRRQLLRATVQRSRDDLLGIVAFDGKPILVASPSPASEIADRSLEYRIQDGTNIADALSLAATLIPADATGRILLITDGAQTAGDAAAAARRIAAGSGAQGALAHGPPIDVVPIRYTLRPEVLVESVDAPPMAAVGAPVTVRAVLRATDPAQGTVLVLDNDTPVDINGARPGAGQRVSLAAGANLFATEVPVGVGRVHRFKVLFEPDAARPDPATGRVSASLEGDRLLDNNSAEAFTITPSVGSVLLVDGVSEFEDERKPSPLARALQDADISVTVVSAGAMPTDLLSLQNYDLVILEDVPADAVSASAQQALAAHVKDMGAGLVMIGGPMSFGAGGWKGSAIEPILPVRLDLPDTLVEPEAAIIFVLDNSGSMGRGVMGSSRSKQELANESAARAVLSLSRTDMVGVIEFNSRFDVLVPLGPNTNPGQSAAAIREIEANGGTNAGPALEEAYRQLRGVKAKVRHIVLLSDGKSSDPQSLPALAKQIHGEGITISAISVGEDADLPTMKAIANNGGGEHFNPTNPNILPRIFLKAIRVVRTPMYREEPFAPTVTDPSFQALRGLGSLPMLGGLNLTQPRPEPTIINAITTPKGEPVLSWWRAELGQVAAFTSDAGPWAGRWIAWRGYPQFWTQLARAMSRPTQDRLFRARLQARGSELALRVEAVDEDGKPIELLEMPGSVYAPSGEEIPTSLKQVGSGVYETTVAASETGTYVAVLRPAGAARRYSPVIAGASVRGGVESQRLDADPALVESLARDSGGRTIELADLGAARLFDRAGIQPRRTLLSLIDLLLPWTLAAMLLDIAMRRIAWDRLIPESLPQAHAHIRSLAERLHETPAVAAAPAAPSPAAFTEQDAAELIRAQRDRRLAQRLAAAREAAAGSAPGARTPDAAPPRPEPTAAPETPTAPESGLAAAKRRARRRFEEEP